MLSSITVTRNFFEQSLVNLYSKSSILTGDFRTRYDSAIQKALQDRSLVEDSLAEMLGVLQDHWASHFENRPRPFHEIFNPDLFPRSLGEITEAVFDRENHDNDSLKGTYNVGGFDFMTEIFSNLAWLLGCESLFSDNLFRLPPPHLILNGAYWVFKNQAAGIEISTDIDIQPHVRDLMAENSRPFCLDSRPQAIHGYQDLHPYVVILHDWYHQLGLSRFSIELRKRFLALYDCFFQADAKIASLPSISEGLGILLDGPPVNPTPPFTYAFIAISIGLQEQEKAGTQEKALQKFINKATLLIKRQFRGQDEVLTPYRQLVA